VFIAVSTLLHHARGHEDAMPPFRPFSDALDAIIDRADLSD
jgi:hypothetical protein